MFSVGLAFGVVTFLRLVKVCIAVLKSNYCWHAAMKVVTYKSYLHTILK